QRESQILEFRPSGSPVNRACLIYILRYSLKTGNINNSIHCHRLPACYKYDSQPCAAFTGKHTAGEENDSQLLSHCRKDIGKDKAENITHNQSAQYDRNEVDSPQSTFTFDLAVQSQGQDQAYQICYNGADNSKFKSKQVGSSHSGVLKQVRIVSKSHKFIGSVTFIVGKTVNHAFDQRKCVK